MDIGGSGFFLIFLLAFVVCALTYYFLRKRVEKKVLTGVMLLFLAGFAIRLLIILQNPLMYGTDGVWYVLKVGHFLEHGNFGGFVAPLVLYFATGCSVFVGDATLGVKIAQAFLTALPILTIWLLVRYITKNNFVCFVVSLLITISGMTVGMADVLRNTGALAFVPLFYLFFFKFVKGEGRKWAIHTPKILGRKFGTTLDTNLVLSIILYLVILGCHLLTAGFVLMTVTAYIAFYIGYRRKLPWPELKFVILLSGLMLLAGLTYAPLQDKVVNTSNGIATSEPIPPDFFPFQGGAFERILGGPSIIIFFIPFLFLSIPAVWFTLRQNDRRYLLFTSTVFLALLCSQDWAVNFMYSFRFMMMIYIALFILVGISVLHVRKSHKKVATLILVGAIGYSLLLLAGMGATMGPSITEEDWTELKVISQQLPENSTILAPWRMGLFYWGSLFFEKENGSTFQQGGAMNAGDLATEMVITGQMTGHTCLALVERDFIKDENLKNLGLEIFDNLQTDRYLVLKLAGESGGTGQSGEGEEQEGLPVYPGAIDLQMSKEEIEEEIFHGGIDLSPPEISAAVYSTTTSYGEVFDWYKTQLPAEGWAEIFDNENPVERWSMLVYSRRERLSIILVAESPEGSVFGLIEGPTTTFWRDPFRPEATSEIRFNHNPLFAFIFLPIEFVQGLYGTQGYGLLKFIVAIPLSVGLIGLLIGLAPSLAHKLKKPHRKE